MTDRVHGDDRDRRDDRDDYAPRRRGDDDNIDSARLRRDDDRDCDNDRRRREDDFVRGRGGDCNHIGVAGALLTSNGLTSLYLSTCGAQLNATTLGWQALLNCSRICMSWAPSLARTRVLPMRLRKSAPNKTTHLATAPQTLPTQ